MNQRLVDSYSAIESSNKDSFSANNLEIDTHWGKSVWGITLQIDLSNEVRDSLCVIQEDLSRLEPNNLLLLPREYQHISVNQVIFWGGTYKCGLEQTWKTIASDFTERFKSLNNTLQSFSITFSKVIATTGGIIWCAYDEHDEMELLRNILFDKLPFPSETTKRNHIIHTTIARFQNKLNNPEAMNDYANKQTDSVTMKVKTVALRNERIFPSIKTKTLAQISLIQ